LLVPVYIPQKGVSPSHSSSVQQPWITILSSTHGYCASQRASAPHAAPWHSRHAARSNSGDTSANSAHSREPTIPAQAAGSVVEPAVVVSAAVEVESPEVEPSEVEFSEVEPSEVVPSEVVDPLVGSPTVDDPVEELLELIEASESVSLVVGPPEHAAAPATEKLRRRTTVRRAVLSIIASARSLARIRVAGNGNRRSGGLSPILRRSYGPIGPRA
jgi:hypothetical protein